MQKAPQAIAGHQHVFDITGQASSSSSRPLTAKQVAIAVNPKDIRPNCICYVELHRTHYLRAQWGRCQTQTITITIGAVHPAIRISLDHALAIPDQGWRSRAGSSPPAADLREEERVRDILIFDREDNRTDRKGAHLFRKSSTAPSHSNNFSEMGGDGCTQKRGRARRACGVETVGRPVAWRRAAARPMESWDKSWTRWRAARQAAAWRGPAAAAPVDRRARGP